MKQNNKGKEKCNFLKKIRKDIAKKLGIDLKQKECTFDGECSGTCPACQMEEKILNEQLLQKGINDNSLKTPFDYPDNRHQTLGAIDYNYFMQERNG